MKNRAIKVIKSILKILLIGVIYGLFVLYTGIGIPCIIKLITGYKCPGCGISRMCLALMKLNTKSAYNYNKVLFLLLPILMAVFAFQLYRYIRYNDAKLTKVQTALLYIAVALLLIWGIIRNTVT
jgi:hypothetical protein